MILSANPSSTGSVSTIRRAYNAPDVEPTIFSPATNCPDTVPTSRTLVVQFHILTLAVVPLDDPVTISLKTNVPDPVLSEFPTTTFGATEYPRPALVMYIAVIVPAALTIAVAAAETVVTPVSNISFVKLIVGESTYPEPPDVTVIIPTTPSPIVEVTAAPVPLPPPDILTEGATV